MQATGRNKNSVKPIKLSLSLHPNVHKILKDLVPSGLYGNSKTEVASTILMEWIRSNAEEELATSRKLVKQNNDDPQG